MKKFLALFPRAAKKLWHFFLEKPFSSALILTLIEGVAIYCLHMRSPIAGLRSMFASPLHTILNFAILLAFFSLPLFFRRRIFGTLFVFAFWLAMGITDCVLLSMRVRPLEAIDFQIVQMGIVTQYLHPVVIVLILALIAAALVGLGFLFFKAPKDKPHRLGALLSFFCVLLVIAILVAGLAAVDGADPSKFKNSRDAYEQYGFPYCFLWSIFDRGIDRPEDYSEETIRALLTTLNAVPDTKPSGTPNIVFVQLESVFDITRWEEIALSADPIPNLRGLRDEALWGLLTVPSIGSGTSNTEFEVLTGLPISFFGAGEYPYETILSKVACESMAYNLTSYGYATHAIHNHTATFYDRHLVYANLGFDVFTGAEFMPDLEENLLGWEKDAVLTDIIMDSLRSTTEQDLVFTVSVQAHGRYPEVPIEGEERAITVTGDMEKERINAIEYYVNQLAETDAFVGELVAALNAYPEDVILVLYGDHLPSLDIAADTLSDGDLFTTEYIVWSNTENPLAGTRVDLAAYELSAAVLGSLGMEDGLISRVHAAYSGDVRLMDMLRLAGYDLLYGDQLAFGGKEPYVPTDMRLGLYDIRVTALEIATEDAAILRGENFTQSSHVYVNGREIASRFVSPTAIYLEDYIPEGGDELVVVQISDDLRMLSKTKPFTIMMVE